jgi:rare lipoprotein A
MYVPAPPAQPALALAPLGITANTPSLAGAPFGRALSTTLSVRHDTLNVLDGHAVTIAGTLRSAPAAAGLPARSVNLQVRGRRGWSTIAHTLSNAEGRFRVRYLPRQTGSRQVRLNFAGDAHDLAAHRRLGRLNVYRLAGASWYGGGGGLACGGSLTSATLGVANKTLPCGTLVTLRYNGRSIRVPVVDRGPYVAGREFDLTQATKQALGFGDTGDVWATR